MAQARPRKAGYLLRSGIWILALCLLLLFPPSVSAHAILLRSNPPIGSVLNGPPTRVQMWFNEHLDPTFTTARVVNLSQSGAQHSANKETRVDLNDAHLVSNDAMELELTLRSNLPSAVYLVFYRTQSAIDGHIVSDSLCAYSMHRMLTLL